MEEIAIKRGQVHCPMSLKCNKHSQNSRSGTVLNSLVCLVVIFPYVILFSNKNNHHKIYST